MSGSLAFGLGAYWGNFGDSSEATRASNWTSLMGVAPSYYDDYVDYTKIPSTWQANQSYFAGLFKSAGFGPSTGMTPVVGVPLADTGLSNMAWGSVDNFYKAVINGTYDADYKAVVDAWQSAGYHTVQFRIAYEFDGNFMPWAPDNSNAPTANADFIAAWQHVANLIHQEGAAKGVTAQTVWNPDTQAYTRPNGQSVAQLYPGDQYIDIISADSYSPTWPRDLANWSSSAANATVTGFASNGTTWASSVTNREHFWHFPGGSQSNHTGSSSDSWSLRNTITLAEQHNKPFSISESGAGNASTGPQGPMDDPAFPPLEARVLASAVTKHGLKVVNVNLWSYDFNGGDNFLGGERPKEAAAWSKYFGAGSAAVVFGGSPLAADPIIPDTQGTTTISQSNVSITATGGNHILYLGGSNDSVSMAGGAETIYETNGASHNTITTDDSNDRIVVVGGNDVVNAGPGSNNVITDRSLGGNRICLPAAGSGVDTLYGPVLRNGDVFDLRHAMLPTSWDGLSSDISAYLQVVAIDGRSTLQIRDTAAGAWRTEAVFHHYSSATLSQVLAEAILK